MTEDRTQTENDCTQNGDDLAGRVREEFCVTLCGKFLDDADCRSCAVEMYRPEGFLAASVRLLSSRRLSNRGWDDCEEWLTQRLLGDDTEKGE
jgi:hypothetical protein